MNLNSTGHISKSIFATCPGTPVFFERIPNAKAGWNIDNTNIIDGENGNTVAALSPANVIVNSIVGNISLSASCPDVQALLRYTIDGSRPDANSMPLQNGVPLVFPSRAIAVNFKCVPPPSDSIEFQQLANILAANVIVESPVAGGIYSVIQ
jgi:hypothetical protein